MNKILIKYIKISTLIAGLLFFLSATILRFDSRWVVTIPLFPLIMLGTSLLVFIINYLIVLREFVRNET